MKSIYYIFMLLCCSLIAGCGSDDPIQEPDPGPGPNPNPGQPTEKAYYISPTGSDDNVGTASAFPFKSFDRILTVISLEIL